MLEDDENASRNLADIINSLGYTPLVANCSGELIDLKDANDYFAAILDNYVPRGRGEEPRKDWGMRIAKDFFRRDKYTIYFLLNSCRR